jgi:two-component system OmpR family response regulator
MTGNATADPVLIVEDDPNIAELVARYLRAAGFRPLVAHDGGEGLTMARERQPQLVILDLMLPVLDGWEVCREIRRNSDVPILFLTAREDEMDRVLGFSLGADDYVVKPFSPRELVERVKAILRRARPKTPSLKVLRQGDLTLEPEKHKVTVAGETVALTPSEYKLLHCLMAAPGRVFSRDELLARLYERGEAVIDRVVDVHIGKLRQKIEPNPSSPVYIRTVHGVGYCLAEDSAA